MIYPILTLLAFIATTVLIVTFERRAFKRRIQKARAEFADAYDAWKRAVHDPYTGNVPSLYEAAEKAGWNLEYYKR